jgi:putative ABC transport system ATP-binding protein
MAGLDGVQEGKILVDGKDIKDIGLMKYRRNYLSVIFQQFNLIRYLSAVDNVINVMETTENSVPKPYKKTALNLLKMLGIVESKAERSIFKLSGGEQQRVAIARGLATNVDLILADEPTGNLDTVTESEIIKVFQNLAKKYNKCVIVVSHSDYVSKHSDVHLDLVDGKLVGRDV